MTLLHVSQLGKRYGETVAVDGVSFDLQAGEVLGLLGPNGAGKTTTMLMIMGLLRPDSGSVMIDGSSYDADPIGLKRRLGFVPQDLAVYPELTARENLRFFAGLYGMSGSTLDRRIDEVLDLIGLAGQRSVVRTFSGGMKRRLNLGVAMLHEPALLILDEPTVGVDPQSRSYLLERVRELGRSGVGVIYASHYMEEVEAICDRVAIMDQGRFVAFDTLDVLLKRATGEARLRVGPWSDESLASLGPDIELLEVERGEALIRLKDYSSRQMAALFGRLDSLGLELRDITARDPNLENLFLKLTGRTLRD